MIVTLRTCLFRSLDDVREFLDGAGAVEFVAPCGDERRQWVAGTFSQFHYFVLGRRDRGAVLALVRKGQQHGTVKTTTRDSQDNNTGQSRQQHGTVKNWSREMLAHGALPDRTVRR